MNEASVRLEVYHSLQGYGYWPIHGRDAIICPRCGAKVLPQVAGRPDLLVLAPTGTMAVMEVKIVDIEQALSFAFTQIDEEQVRWLDAWVEHKGLGYLAIGTLGEKPRRLWVIPWARWQFMRITFDDRKWTNIPIDHGLYKHISKAVPLLSVVTEFSAYEMTWITDTKIQGEKFTGSHWAFPKDHELIKERICLWLKKWKPMES